jgi:hypothetical protein
MPAVEILWASHDRLAFSCGNPGLDEFLHRQARQNADRNLGVTYVVVPAPGDSRVLGYYTLVTRTVESAIVPSRGLPRGPLRVVLLGRLAVDRSC